MVFLLILSACGDLNEQRANHEKIREGIEQHEIKRITADQIMAAAYLKGNKVLTPFLDEPPKSPSYWQGVGSAHLDTLISLNELIEVNCISLDQIGEAEFADTQNQILDAYSYSFEQGQDLTENVQVLNDTIFWYTKPYVYQDSILGIWSVSLNKKDLIKEL